MLNLEHHRKDVLLRTFNRGDIEFTISIQGVNDDIVYVLQANYCNDYTVTINSDNSVTSSGQER
jgi:hypothetical protein